MTALKVFSAVVAIALVSSPALAQAPAKPGPELDLLKKMVGKWDLTVKMQGSESKGAATYKMEVGGMWLVSSLEGEIFGSKFYGKGLDSYDAAKKKYVSVWVDSMSSSPMIMEGDYDKTKKTITLTGEGPGMTGKPVKYKSTSEMPDDDTINFVMYVGESKEPAFTIVYKRKK